MKTMYNLKPGDKIKRISVDMPYAKVGDVHTFAEYKYESRYNNTNIESILGLRTEEIIEHHKRLNDYGFSGLSYWEPVINTNFLPDELFEI